MKRINLLLIIGLLSAFQLFSQKDPPGFAPFGSCYLNAGLCNEVFIQGNIAYVGSEAGLIMLDISNPSDPYLSGSYLADSYVDGVFVKDNTAYITKPGLASPSEVDIVDISNPNAPTLIHSFETGDHSNNSILVHDTLLFLAMSYSSCLQIYDISNLLNPVLVIELADINPDDMVAREDYLYMVDHYYFGILDLSNLSDPQLLCWIGDYSTVRSNIDIQDSLAYLTGYSLDIFDITDPANPVQLCDFESDILRDIEISGHYCYTFSNDSLYIINVENPGAPAIQNTYCYEGRFLDYQDNLLTVSTISTNSCESFGFGIFDIDSTQQFTLLAEHFTDKAKDVCVSNNYAYVANGYSGLKIINVANPSSLVPVNTLLDGQYVYELIIEDDYAYVRTSESLKIVDISIPANASVIGTYNFSHYTSMHASYAIEKYSDYVYIGGDLSEIYVIDVSDPYHPVHVGLIDPYDYSPDLDVYEDHLYVAGYWGGLEIYDLSNPVNPSRIGEHPLGLAFLVAAGEDKVFIGGDLDQYSGGIEIFDVSDLTIPYHAGTYPTYSTDLEISNNFLFSGRRTHMDLNSSIHIINVTDIYSPYLIQEIPDVAPNGLFYQDEKIYAVEDFKLIIFGDSLTLSTNDEPVSYNSLKLTCYPNPTRNKTCIKFDLDNQSFVQLLVHNSRGELIDVLMHRNIPRGGHMIEWNGMDANGMRVPQGIYIISLQADNIRQSERLVLIGN